MQPDPTDTPRPERWTLGSYELLQQLGAGAMGCVYLARHARLGRRVAIKLLRPEHTRDRRVVERFLLEARTVNQISHENIVEVFDFVEEADGRIWCVMELLEGKTLGERMREGLALRPSVDLLRQICSALQAAHAQGVVHRDLKPDNIFVCQKNGRDHVKVLDFGLAKLLRPISEAPRGLTTEGTIVGTPAYMSPEQAAGAEVDARSDLFALGIIAFEMLSGRPPFQGNSFGELAMQIAALPTPRLSPESLGGESIPPELAQVVMRCLEKKPAARFQSAQEIGAALEHLSLPEVPLLHLSVDQVGIAQPPEASVAPTKRRGRLALALAVALAALASAAALLWRHSPTRAPALAVEPLALAAPEPAPPPSPPPPETVTFAVTSTPAGARVVRVDTGEQLGATPLTLDFPAEDRELAMRLELPGYQPTERRASLRADGSLQVILLPAPNAPKKPSGPKPKVHRNGVMDPFAQ